MTETIGDYYDRKRKEQHEAWEKWTKAVQKYKDDPSYENGIAMSKAEDKMIDACNTGD